MVDQVCNMTNLGWVIDKGALEKQFGYQVGVLNDFEAVGYGVRHVDPENMVRFSLFTWQPAAHAHALPPAATQLEWVLGLTLALLLLPAGPE